MELINILYDARKFVKRVEDLSWSFVGSHNKNQRIDEREFINITCMSMEIYDKVVKFIENCDNPILKKILEFSAETECISRFWLSQFDEHAEIDIQAYINIAKSAAELEADILTVALRLHKGL
jgi:hypothetical protein